MEKLKSELLEACKLCKSYPQGILSSELGSAIKKINPFFNPKDYGFEKFICLLQELPDTFRITEDTSLSAPRHFVELVEAGDVSEEQSPEQIQPQCERKNGIICDLREERGYGFIIEDNPPEDLDRGRRMFLFSMLPDSELRYIKMSYANGERNIPVTYSLCPSGNEANKNELADKIRCSALSDATRARMVLELRSWCFFQDQEGMLRTLASSEYTLPEDWGTAEGPQPFPILWNYLRHTFKKLQMERLAGVEEAHKRGDAQATYDTVHVGVHYSPDFKLAAFNTGLVNYCYEPVIAVFESNDPYSHPPYKFKGFCIRGEKALGKEVQGKIFGELNRARYFNKVSDCVYLDPSAEVQADWDHIIFDGIRRGRFPNEFLQETCVRALRALGIDTAEFSHEDLERIEQFIKCEESKKTYNNIKGRVETALKLALKRVTWNFKTVSPVWYPKAKHPTLLLPLALVDDHIPDAALVVEQIEQSDGHGHSHINYTAHTIYTLKIAYNNSRLVCKPDSDWLSPQKTSERAGERFCEEQ